MSNPIEDKILETLSFYDAYSWERLIVEFDEGFLRSHPDFAKEDLEMALKTLKKRGLVAISKSAKGELLMDKTNKHLFPI